MNIHSLPFPEHGQLWAACATDADITLPNATEFDTYSDIPQLCASPILFSQTAGGPYQWPSAENGSLMSDVPISTVKTVSSLSDCNLSPGIHSGTLLESEPCSAMDPEEPPLECPCPGRIRNIEIRKGDHTCPECKKHFKGGAAAVRKVSPSSPIHTVKLMNSAFQSYTHPQRANGNQRNA